MKHKAFFIKRFRDIQKEIIDLEYKIEKGVGRQKLTTTINQIKVKQSRKKNDDIFVDFEKLESRLYLLYKKRDELECFLIDWFNNLGALNTKIAFEFVIKGLTFNEIATKVGLTKKTVEKMFIKSLELLELDIE